MNHPLHLLIVDDDDEIRFLLIKLLKEYNYTVSSASHGTELFEVLRSTHIDLIILDLMLPGDDGLTLCQKIRAIQNTPIIILTASGEDNDKVSGLELGADDYMSKPFNPRELHARIKAVLRRTHESHSTIAKAREAQIVTFNEWSLDLQMRILKSPEGIEVDLSTGEFTLLQVFVRHAAQVLSRDELSDFIQHRPAGPFDRSIDVQVSRLRQKLGDNPKKPTLIKTVRGGGYLFTAQVMQFNHEQSS